MRHPCDIYKIARQCGVKLMETQQHSPTSRKPMECYCKPTVREIGQAHGEDHLKLVLMLMTGTPRNAGELYSDTIKAVSELLIGWPELVKRKTLTDEFNQIDLRAYRQFIKGRPVRVANWQAILMMLVITFESKERAAA